VPGFAAAAGQSQNLTEMLASSAAIQATAVSGPLISVSPLTLNFGTVDNGATGSLLLTVSNTGDQTLNVLTTAYGDPAYSSPPFGAGLAPGTSRGITVSFHPTDGMAHPGTLTITSNASNGTQLIPLTGQGNAAPTLSPIGNKTVSAFTALNFTVTGTDNDDTVDDVITFSMGSGLPPSATFNSGTGAFSWSPSAAEEGTYTVAFSAFDGRLSDSETITIVVSLTNRPPVANAGGTYFGATGRPLQFNGLASTDPDIGQTLTYAWTFGDGASANGSSPQHTYQIPGSFIATLTVCDTGTPQLCSADAAAVTIQTEVGAQVILKNNGTVLNAKNKEDSDNKVKLGIEEVLVPYTDAIQTSIRIATTFPNAGTVASCPADLRFVKYGDMDVDGVADMDVKFTKACLSQLFSNTPNNTAVTIVITGQFNSSGGTIPLHAERLATIKTVNNGHAVAAFASPNPFNPETSISYTVQSNGPVTMRIYGIDGRLVRTLRNAENTNAGTHEVRWNGTNEQGHHMPSGIYFVKTSQQVSGSEESSVLKVALTK
jgi:hypothetical protein